MSQHLKAHCKIFRIMRDIWFATRVFFVRGLHFEKVSFFGLPFSDVLTPQLLNLATHRISQLPSQIQKEAQILDVTWFLLGQFVPVSSTKYGAKWSRKKYMRKTTKKKTRFFDLTLRAEMVGPSLFHIRETGFVWDLLQYA